jgi:flagellar hook-length control protein FliK
LDANSAREIPAQQQTIDPNGAQAQTPAGALAFAHSILQSVAAQLAGDSHAQAAAQRGADTNVSQAAPRITVQSDDVLGRMLARAASADAQRAPQAPGPPAPASAPGQPSATSSQIFARLLNVIAEAAKDQQSSSNGGKQSSQSGYGKGAGPAPNPLQPSSGIAAPAFSTAIGNAQPVAASSPASSAASVVDPQAVIEQIVSGLVLRKSGGTSELRMHLQPEHLGDVSLKLTVTGNSISANMIAQNPHVRDVLLANQDQLARSLADVGLSLGNFSVDVSGGNAGFTQQQHAQHKSALARTTALHGISGDDDDSWTDSSFGPPVLPASASLVFNYLA